MGALSTADGTDVLPSRTTGRRDALRAYLIVAALASVPLAIQTLRTNWSLDVWQHAAAVLEFSRNPLDPGHPTVAADVGHPDLSPYMLVWGLVQRVTGIDALTVLIIAGLFNLAAIWVGLWMVCTRLTRARYAPALAVPAVLLVWGYRPWRWSGYPSLNSIGFGLPYPSFGALAAYLIGVAVFIDWIREPRWARAWIVAALGAFAALAHPITGAAFGLSAAALLVEAAVRGGPPRRTALIQIGVAAGAALIAVVAWPFYSVFSVFDHADSYSRANTLVLERIPTRAGLALLCVPLVVILGRHRRDWRLFALAGPPLVLVAIGVTVDSPALGRFLPFALLPAQLALADVVAGAFSPRARWRNARFVFGAGIAAVGLVGVAAAFPRMVPDPLLPDSLRDDERLETARSEEDQVAGAGAGMNVIAPEDDLAWPTLGTGAKLVAPPYGAPEVSDSDARIEAVDDFLDAPVRTQQEIAAEYGATHVLLSQQAADQIDVAGLGTIVWTSDDAVLIRL